MLYKYRIKQNNNIEISMKINSSLNDQPKFTYKLQNFDCDNKMVENCLLYKYI
jgi:hypothetical protein